MQKNRYNIRNIKKYKANVADKQNDFFMVHDKIKIRDQNILEMGEAK